MVRSTIAMAHELGMKVVAEGVEDEQCLVQLAEMGCDTAQGWHIGRPMPATDLIRFLDNAEQGRGLGDAMSAITPWARELREYWIATIRSLQAGTMSTSEGSRDTTQRTVSELLSRLHELEALLADLDDG